jgi:murein DD-endopeptidase MepM/ murein hydrolase activator NlpD
MQPKYFTFLYIPAENAEPKPLRMRRSLVYAVLGVMGLGVAVAGAAAMMYSGKIRETYKLARLEHQNERLEEELDRFSSELDGLRRQVSQNFDFQKKARLLANLDDLAEDVTEVGVGGPDFAYVRSLGDLDSQTRAQLFSARQDVGKLLRQSRLQQESYGEIIASLEATNEVLRATPSLAPVNVGFVSSGFGWRMDPITGRRTMHRGLDFSARLGTPVYAPADGVVTFSGTWRTYGEVIEVSHGQGYLTRYAHLQKRLVREGQRIRRGDVLGRVGSSGKSTFSHLHYEVEKDGKRVNPQRYVLSL